MICEKVAQSIRKDALIKPEDKVLVAISGGPDSVLLAYTLHQLGYQIGLAHLNYNLRAEASDAEEKLVRQYAAEWGVPVYVHSADTKAHATVHKLSMQLATRRLRYRFFDQLMAEEGYTVCATAHQANDQIESILMSLLKGNSPKVLKGIPLRRGPYVRPMLNVSRTEVLTCLAERKLSYGMDATNEESYYLRNKFRNQVIPILHHINPSVGDQILERFDWYARQYRFMEVVLNDWLDRCLQPEGNLLQWEAFVAKFGWEHLPLLLMALGERMGWHGHSLWRLNELITASNGKYIELDTLQIYRREEGLWWESVPMKRPPRVINLPSLPRLASFPWGNRKVHLQYPTSPPYSFGEPGVFYLDSQRLSLPLVIRSWQEGDRMQPFGMRGEKKLSDIFIDQKFTAGQKENAIVIADQQQIVAVSDFRIADSVRVDQKSGQVLKIVIEDPK